jgi:hypothetical protein
MTDAKVVVNLAVDVDDDDVMVNGDDDSTGCVGVDGDDAMFGMYLGWY